jgi:hypothetical protein
MTTDGRVLAVVVCGAGSATGIGMLIGLARDRGWTVQVIATPAALEFACRLALASARPMARSRSFFRPLAGALALLEVRAGRADMGERVADRLLARLALAEVQLQPRPGAAPVRPAAPDGADMPDAVPRLAAPPAGDAETRSVPHWPLSPLALMARLIGATRARRPVPWNIVVHSASGPVPACSGKTDIRKPGRCSGTGTDLLTAGTPAGWPLTHPRRP